jgi:hypothetical protein
MHIDPTLGLLTEATTSLGNRIREFDVKTCALFQTRELERERAARQRRRENASATGAKSTEAETTTAAPGKHVGKRKAPNAPSDSGRRPKSLNLKTYKYHALGDYVATIHRFGTTDSYSTQPVGVQLAASHSLLTTSIYQSEREHRTSKARFVRTSGRSIPCQIAKIETRERRIRMIRDKLRHPSARPPAEPDDIINDPQVQYNMGKSQKSPVHIPTFLRKNADDPAVKVSKPM